MTGLLLASFLAAAALIVAYARWVHPKVGWAAPTTIVLVNFALHYPVRGGLVVFGGYNRAYGFDESEVAAAILYATLFIAVAVFFFIRKWPSNNAVTGAAVSSTRSAPAALVHAVFLVYVAAFAYVAGSNALFGLGVVENSNFEIVAKFILAVKWFLIGYYLVLARERWRAIVVLELGVVVATIVVSAVVSTSKGELVSLLVTVVLGSAIRRKPIPKAVLVGGVAFVLAFSVYSYLARYYGVVSGRSEWSVVADNFDRVMTAVEDVDVVREKGVDQSVDRFLGLDGLILCQRRGTLFENNEYRYGSIVELVSIVPRFLWEDRPRFGFNYFVTQDVWGLPGSVVSSTPLGRIGESFYVANWGGLLYAILYGLAWRWMYLRLYRGARSLYGPASYIGLMFYTAFSDDNLISNLPVLALITSIATLGVLLEGRRDRLRPEGRRLNVAA